MFIASEVFWLGAFGGLASEILHWWGLRESEDFPTYGRSVFYWTVTILMILTGAGIAYLQLGPGGNTFLAFELGVMAPMLLKKIGTNSTQPSGAQGQVKSPTLRQFLRG